MQDFRKIEAWQKARKLTIAVHRAVRPFPPHSAPDLRPQLFRAVASIASNIVEGAMRETRADFARFLTTSISTAAEAEHHLQTCADLGLVSEATIARLIDQLVEVRRMTFGFREAVLRADQDEKRRQEEYKERQKKERARRRRRPPPPEH